VTSYDRIVKSSPAVEFHVEAMLMIEPAPERIAFDTVLEVGKGSYRVKD
jgi:predicted component of type VI protein secretion system